jgi:hypothetical protein
MQEVKAAPHADDPFTVLDIEFARGPAYFGNMRQIAQQQRQQVGAHLRRHVRKQRGKTLGQVGHLRGIQCRQVERAAIRAVQDEGVLVRFETAYEGVDRAVAEAKDMFHLGADFQGVGARGLGVVIESGTAAVRITLGIMVGDQHQHLTPCPHHLQDMVREHLAQVGPSPG